MEHGSLLISEINEKLYKYAYQNFSNTVGMYLISRFPIRNQPSLVVSVTASHHRGPSSNPTDSRKKTALKKLFFYPNSDYVVRWGSNIAH